MSELAGRQPGDEDADALSAYWDRLIDGAGAVVAPGSLADVARLLHGVDDVPPLPASQRALIWEQVLRHPERVNGPPRLSLNGSVAANGRAPALFLAPRTTHPERVPSPSRRSAMVSQLATAALLLLTLGIGYLALGPARHASDTLPSIAVPELPETVLAVTIPADYVPLWDVADVAFAYEAIPPGIESTWKTPALRIEYVVSGSYTVRSDGPIQIIRRGSATQEAVAPDQEVELRPGDALIAPPQTSSSYHNRGQQSADVLIWSLSASARHKEYLPNGWVYFGRDLRTGLSLQPGPAAVRLQRVILEPDETIPSQPRALQMSVASANRDHPLAQYDLARTGAGAVRNLGDRTITVYVITVAAAGTGALMP